MKTYIFSYNNHSEYTNAELDNILRNLLSKFGDFKKDMEFSFIIASNRNAQFIADAIINDVPKLRFLITEIASNRQGWLPKETWDFIKENSD